MPDFLAEVLSLAKNQQYRLEIATAAEWGIAPTEQLLARKNPLTRDQLHNINRKLRAAWKVLQDETCSSCGTVAWHGRSDDSTIDFQTKETTCYGCATVENERSERKKIDPGTTLYPVAKVVDADELPSRSDWYERMWKEQQIRARQAKAAE